MPRDPRDIDAMAAALERCFPGAHIEDADEARRYYRSLALQALTEYDKAKAEAGESPEPDLSALDRRLGAPAASGCTCGASGGMDGHGYFCALRGPFHDL